MVNPPLITARNGDRGLRIVHGTVISHIKRSLNTKSFQLLIKMSQ